MGKRSKARAGKAGRSRKGSNDAAPGEPIRIDGSEGQTFSAMEAASTPTPLSGIVHTTPLRVSEKDSTDALLAERGKTHGKFEDNARLSQRLKSIFHQEDPGFRMRSVQKEALDMFAIKISRILSTGGGVKDDWDDIAGYARLASKTFEGDEE